MTIEQLFFELIRVAIGTQDTLSRPPSACEWAELYNMAKKQSLVGVCFAGVQKLQTQSQEPPEMLYLTWMGMAAKIQQRNEVVTKQCAELQAKLSADGFRSCILKGQGVAQVYPESLRGLRQSGDIDVWVLPNEGESEKEHIARVVRYARGINPESHFSGKHIDLAVFQDTEVEMHVTPARMNCPKHERRLKTWFQEVLRLRQFQEVSSFSTPSNEFNLVYLLLHCYDHLLFEGVGLRQIMDYYFVLRDFKTKTIKTADSVSFGSVNLGDADSSFEIMSTLPSSADKSSLDANVIEETASAKNIKNILETLQSLGLMKFAGAMMWVIARVFANDNFFLGIKPNEKEGRFLLNEIMTGGNFGKYGNDGVMEGYAKGKVAFFMARMKRNWRFLTHYPSEIIWSPYAMLSHWIWKRNVKI